MKTEWKRDEVKWKEDQHAWRQAKKDWEIDLINAGIQAKNDLQDVCYLIHFLLELGFLTSWFPLILKSKIQKMNPFLIVVIIFDLSDFEFKKILKNFFHIQILRTEILI